MRKVAGAVFGLVLAWGSGLAQKAAAPVETVKQMDPKADPAFEVATIKPTAPNEKNKMLTLQGTRLVVVNMGLIDLLSFAYDVQPKQVVNAPGWITTDMFDVTAVPDTEGAPDIQQMKLMIRKLATDRFGFRFKEEKREMPVYALTVAKTGPKLTHSVATGANPGFGLQGVGKLGIENATMDEFSGFLQSVVVDRPVANQTALQGRWDFQIHWTVDESQFGGRMPPAPAPTDGAEQPPSLYTALQEQDGLKLEPGRAPVRVLVVTGVEKPSAN